MPTITLKLGEVQELLATMRTGGPKVLVRTINETLKGVRTDVTNEVAAAVNLPKTFIRKQTSKKSQRTFYLKQANYASAPDYSGYLEVKGANVSLIQYSNQRGAKFRRAKRVSVLVQKSRGRKIFRHAFPMKMPSGHRGIFEFEEGVSRTGRRSIKELYGSRVPDVLSNKETFDKVEKHATARMDKALNKHLDHLLSITR